MLHTERGNEVLNIGWHALVLAIGSQELFLPFPGWTLPNVIGAGGLQLLGKSGWPVAGQRVVVAGSGPLSIAVAAYLVRHGARVTDILEQAPWRSPDRDSRCDCPALAPAKVWQAVGLPAQSAAHAIPRRLLAGGGSRHRPRHERHVHRWLAIVDARL